MDDREEQPVGELGKSVKVTWPDDEDDDDILIAYKVIVYNRLFKDDGTFLFLILCFFSC